MRVHQTRVNKIINSLRYLENRIPKYVAHETTFMSAWQKTPTHTSLCACSFTAIARSRPHIILLCDAPGPLPYAHSGFPGHYARL